MHDDRRIQGQAACKLVDGIDARLNAGDARMTRMEQKIDANSSDTSEVLEIVRLGKGFFRGLGHLAAFVKYCVIIGGGIATIWGLWPKK